MISGVLTIYLIRYFTSVNFEKSDAKMENQENQKYTSVLDDIDNIVKQDIIADFEKFLLFSAIFSKVDSCKYFFRCCLPQGKG